MISDARRGFAGVWALLRGDPEFPKFFDVGAAGFVRSFAAAVLSAPIYIFVVAAVDRAAGTLAPGSEPVNLVLYETVKFAVMWSALPVTAPLLLRLAGLDRTLFSPWVVVHNWTLFVLHFLMASSWLLYLVGVLDAETALRMHVSVYLPVTAVIHWRVTKAVLNVGWSMSGALAFAHVLFSLIGQLLVNRVLQG